MSDVYDWAADEVAQAEPTWAESYMPRRSAQVAQIRAQDVERGGPQDRLNPINRHALDCGCPTCPGWYEARARMAVAAHAYAEPVVKEVQPRPLVDQVVPVAILMVVFTMCMAVLLPILVPMMALGAVSLALVAVSLVVVVTCALGFMVFVLRVKRDTGGQVVRGQVLKRR